MKRTDETANRVTADAEGTLGFPSFASTEAFLEHGCPLEWFLHGDGLPLGWVTWTSLSFLEPQRGSSRMLLHAAAMLLLIRTRRCCLQFAKHRELLLQLET